MAPGGGCARVGAGRGSVRQDAPSQSYLIEVEESILHLQLAAVRGRHVQRCAEGVVTFC